MIKLGLFDQNVGTVHIEQFQSDENGLFVFFVVGLSRGLGRA